MDLTSLIEDHEPAHAYACYLADVKGKVWGDVYIGARWELALAAYLGIREECAAHLARVHRAVTDDFEFDFRVGGLKVDAKATMSPPGRRNNLIVTRSRLRNDVAYVLGDLRVGRKPARNDPALVLVFDAVGWSMGAEVLFRPCPFPRMGHAVMRDAADLRSVTELREACTDHASFGELDAVHELYLASFDVASACPCPSHVITPSFSLRGGCEDS